MESIPVTVINSKAAQNHFNDISVKHDDLLDKMRAHNERVGMYNQQVQEEQRSTDQENKQMKIKEEELKIKRDALMM